MCGRYVLHGPHSRLREYFDLRDCAAWEPRYNIAPQSDILVVRQRPEVGRVGQLVRWGLIPRWAKDASSGLKLSNARAETVAEKPSFKASFERHRCLIPACRDVHVLSRCLLPAPAAGMVAYPVSRRVSSARNEGSQLLEPDGDGSSASCGYREGDVP